MADPQLLCLNRGYGKTRALVNDVIDTLLAMRKGKVSRGNVGVVLPNHDRQKHFLRSFEDGLRARSVELGKAESIEVFNEASVVRERGRKFKYVFVDDAHDFEHGLQGVLYFMPDAEMVIATYTPETMPTLLLIEIVENEALEKQLRKMEAERREREHWADWWMMIWMQLKIEGKI